MSRAFVKESDFEQPADDYTDRPQSSSPNYVTPRGHRALEARHQALALERAGLPEDSDDPLVKQRILEVERDLRYYQGRLEKAVVVDPSAQPTDEVHFGSRVTVEDENGERHEFSIVGEDEVDVATGRVSWASPLAKAMIGNRVGDTVTWHRPAGDLQLEIVAIAPLSDES